MPTGKPAQSGFTYLFVLMLIALIGMGLAAAGTLWSTEAQRAREADLLFVGNQYRQAIRSYYELDPSQPRLPQSVDDLLEDNRRPDIVRHLRRAYRDPINGGKLALILAPDKQGIVGVYSSAPGKPIKVSGFLPENKTFADAVSYAKWRFVFTPAPTSTQLAPPNTQASASADQPATPTASPAAQASQPAAPAFRPAPRAGQPVELQ
jgi:type II secretory pathway pseudopilin PulG